MNRTLPFSRFKLLAFVIVTLSASAVLRPAPAFAAYHFADFSARPPIHEMAGKVTDKVLAKAMTPNIVKSAYGLPRSGGAGTIAIIGAHDVPHIEADLATFSNKFGLAECTGKNGCFEKHVIGTPTIDTGWAMETALDVEWAHAIAPQAKILLVSAPTQSGANLVKAVDYARSRADVVAVSMSWGGPEFEDETTLDEHFSSKSGATFFAASGDNGAGASWPAASPRVIAVGGTKLTASGSGFKETAWTGSGGGVSAYEMEPVYQQRYKIAQSGGMRAIPDVAYNADPKSGFPVYSSDGPRGAGWHIVGGTSAGAPQWAAIRALSTNGFDAAQLYTDKADKNTGGFFRDIKSGKNGDCGYYCSARSRYDYVTGLGTPRTANF